MTPWDGLPRAVFPSTQLQEAQVPVLATYSHAEASPLPYGLAVYVMDSTVDGAIERHLPLYWVSSDAAAERNIDSGWYIAAEKDKVFSLRLTDVQLGHHHLHGVTVAQGRACAAEVYVDGTNVEGFAKAIDKPYQGRDRVYRGFTLAKTYAGVSGGTKSLSLFKFKQNTALETTSTRASSAVGTIEFKIFCGPYKEFQQTPSSWNEPLKDETPINEKEVVKGGKSIGVDRTGTVVQEPNNHIEGFFWTIERENEYDGGFVGKVTIYMREKSWMIRNRIMHGIVKSPKSSTAGNIQQTRKPKRKSLIFDQIDLTESPPKTPQK